MLGGFRCPLLKYNLEEKKEAPGWRGWIVLCVEGCASSSSLLVRVGKKPPVLCLQAIAGVCLPLQKEDSHKVHKELQLENNAPPWQLKLFQLQAMVQLQVQLHSVAKS